MDRNVGKGMMGQKNYEQGRYSSVETRNEVIGSTNQRFFQDPSSSINTNIRPPDFAVPVGARPVLNYSIQTGEEFALEFMRERVNPKQHLVPHASGGTTGATSYMDLKDILGISHTGSETGSDISMIASIEKGRDQNHERTRTSVNDEKSYHQVAQSVTRTSSRNNNIRGFQSHVSSRSSTSGKLRCLCSFGGRIMPRPSDGKLRYVGGDTHLIRVSKDVSYEELMQKMLMIYNQAHTIKYQLPGEDLDALVSVSCDEDVQNMIEECNGLEGDGSQKLRIFLLSNSDLDDAQAGLENVEGDSEMQYVVSVNGMDFGSRRNSIALASASGNNLDEFLSLTIARENGRVAADASHSVGGVPLAGQSAHVMASSSLHAFDSNQQGYHGQSIHQGGAEWRPLPTSMPVDNFQNLDAKSVLPQYDHDSHPPNSSQLTDNFVVGTSRGYLNGEGGSTHEQPYRSSHMNGQEAPAVVVKMKRDTSFQKKVELGKDQSLEKEVLKEAKMKRESSAQKLNDPEKMHSVESEKVVSSNPLVKPAPNHVSRVEASNSAATVVSGSSDMPSKINEKSQEQVQGTLSLGAVQEEKLDGSSEDGHISASGRTSNADYGDSEAYPYDLSYDPPSMPPRVFRSERLPREQAGLNRLSKSDDSSQFIMTHAHSEGRQQILESVDKLHDGNVSPQTERFTPSGPNRSANQPAIEEKQIDLQQSVELGDNTKGVNSKVGEDVSEANLEKRELKAATYADKVKSGPNNASTSNNVRDESASKPNELRRGDAAASRTEENKVMGKIQPLAESEPQVGAVATGKPAVTTGSPDHGDILIDINDHFPREFLSDIFSRAKILGDASVSAPLRADGTGLSLNMENHEPKHWSFFQKLAQDDFVRKDVSLIDQDHLSLSSTRANGEDGASMDYGYPPFNDSAMIDHMDSRMNIEADMQHLSRDNVGPSTMNVPSEYDPSQTTGIQSMQYDGAMNSKVPESDYQDENQEVQNTGFPLIDLSMGDFDPSSLQIIKNEDLEELRELGSGTFGTVYHGKWRGTDVAIKRIKKSCFTGRSSEQERLTLEFWREAEILSKLHHPNVVAFYGVVQDGPGGTLATVTEFMVNGSLRHVLLCKDRHLDRRKKLIIAMDAAFGMEYLHSKNIVHFDLKCDNLLVNLKDPSRPICKVGDFGLSKIKRNTLVTGGVRGTLPWMAPELLNGSSNKVSEKVDVFSFGIVLWEILTGEEPYANMHYGAIIGGIVNNTLRPLVPSFCDTEWRILMEQCWAPDPAVRPSFTEIARRLRAMTAACPTRPQAHPPQNQQSK
ncbi:RAF-like serine/threonine-protein kinase PRAF [Nicotiana tomentosiformis]|uniref:RAF-like serine/threonine-protein kinase PRAF n=1 Tax=Nicotiana tomentosiformis TaxID=4098 RepID=UPI00051ABA12|nr:uncharacterized protein LOC104098578 [Nicotiana tomentosiformis]